ncbi:MAG TPA: hypothetical protein DEP78_10085, partial [Verrucomicrobiales bacterium]|nr:hypothetical protein [Verrucomicrobiales bacterium]
RAYDWIRVEAFGEEKINLKQCIRWLQKHWQVRRLVVEGGGHLNDAMFREGLVDELFLTLCPLIYGGRHHATIADGVGFTQLSDAYRLRCVERKRKGRELFLRFLREPDGKV